MRSTTLLYVAGRGLVVEEPSVIALEGDSGEVAAVGSMAEALSGREPEGIAVVWPFIADVEASTLMLNAFLHRAHVHRASCGRWP